VTIPAEAQELVRAVRLGFVATVHADGTPNLSPKGTTNVFDADHLVFADIASPNTVANLCHRPNVEVNVVHPLLRRGYRFRGVGSILAPGQTTMVRRRRVSFEEVLTFYREIGIGVDIESILHVVLVRVLSVSPLLSPVYATGIDEQTLATRWHAHYGACLSTTTQPRSREV
jgi:uncharacterized protein